MTSIVVDRPDSGWEQVPRRLPDDWRLSLDTRAVACWVATRTNNFTLSVGGLRTCLGIGKDLWKRMRKELEVAGYLENNPDAKDSRGRFATGLIFHVVPVGGFPSRPPKAGEKLPKTAAQPGAAQPDAVEPEAASPTSTRKVKTRNLNTRDLNTRERAASAALGSLSDSQNKEKADKDYALSIGKKAGMTDDEIKAVLSSCRYPSGMPRAMDEAVKKRSATIGATRSAEGVLNTAMNVNHLIKSGEVVSTKKIGDELMSMIADRRKNR